LERDLSRININKVLMKDFLMVFALILAVFGILLLLMFVGILVDPFYLALIGIIISTTIIILFIRFYPSKRKLREAEKERNKES